MNFYTKEHLFYCGVDLHTRSMYMCVLDQSGQILLHRNLPADPQRFIDAVTPFRQDIVVCAGHAHSVLDHLPATFGV